VGKIIFWIVVFFFVLLALRLVSIQKTRSDAKARRDAADAKAANDARQHRRDDTPANETMIKCARCGVFVPKSNSLMSPAGAVCNDAKCSRRS
jgi:hypothetical protein